MLLTLSLLARSGGSTFVTPDSSVCKRTGNFGGIARKFLNFSDFDTIYISPNRYSYALILNHFANYKYYSVGSATPEPQRPRFSPKPRNKIGVYFGWRWIFLGWAIDADGLYREKSGKKRGTGFNLGLYGSKLGADIIYRRTGNSYKIHDITSFPDRIPTDYSEDFDGLGVKVKRLNLYYVFNNRHFSCPAAFSQSTNQRHNAGSFITGFSVSTHNLDFDYTKLPNIIRETMNPGVKVGHIKYTNISLNFGCVYDWVFARDCLARLPPNLAMVYKTSRVNKTKGEKNDWHRNFNIDFILRAGIVYNNSEYFVGTSLVGRTYDYYRDNFSLNNEFGALQVYTEFNFRLEKECRKKKRQ